MTAARVADDPTEESPNVTVVTLNWNNYADTVACVRSLADVDYPAFEVVVVDNGSTDGSGAQLERTFGDRAWCTVVRNESNLGFGGGMNTGIARALADGAEYVLLLNNDATLEPGCLQELVAVAAETDAGVVGAQIITETGVPVNPTPSRHPDMLLYSGYRDRIPLVADEPAAGARWWPTDRVEGAGALLSRDLLEDRAATVGQYLDASLFMYCEEVELALWCREHGYRALIAAEARVRHDSGASSNRAFQLYYLTRNRILLAHRYLAGPERYLFDVVYAITRAARLGRYLKDGQPGIARAILQGLRDGYADVSGQTR